MKERISFNWIQTEQPKQLDAFVCSWFSWSGRWESNPRPVRQIRKIRVDATGLTHRYPLHLSLPGRDFAPKLRPTFSADVCTLAPIPFRIEVTT